MSGGDALGSDGSDGRSSRWNTTGGVDEIPTRFRGRLFLCGKHAIAPDVDGLMRSVGATTVVCLVERHELDERYPQYVAWLDSAGPDQAIWFPIHDLGAPPVDEFEPVLDDIVGRLDSGASVVVHCGAGIGRAGTVAVTVLLRCGLSLDDALRAVRTHRSMAGPEIGAQADLARAVADRSTPSS